MEESDRCSQCGQEFKGRRFKFCPKCGTERSNPAPRSLKDFELVQWFLESCDRIFKSGVWMKWAEDSLSRRIVFLFPDGTLITVAHDGLASLSHLDKELSPNEVVHFPEIKSVKAADFNKAANGWVFPLPSKQDFESLIQHMEAKRGKASVGCPFSSLAQELIENGFQDYLDQHCDEDLAPSFHRGTYRLLRQIAKCDIPTSRAVDAEFSKLPKFSSVERFNRFRNHLEDQYSWQFASEWDDDFDPDLPLFAYSENDSPDLNWFPLGGIEQSLHTEQKSELKILCEAADLVGLDHKVKRERSGWSVELS